MNDVARIAGFLVDMMIDPVFWLALVIGFNLCKEYNKGTKWGWSIGLGFITHIVILAIMKNSQTLSL